MADNKGASAPAAPPASGKVYEYENRTRFVFRFPRYTTTKRGETTQLVVDHDRALVLGDMADKTLPPGVVRGPRCPDPVARISAAELAAMSAPNRKLLDALVASDQVQRREVAA